MSSLNKVERKHTDATVSMTHFYNSVSSEASLHPPRPKPDIKEPLLDNIINPHDNYEEEPTLEDVLLASAALFYAYLSKKEEKGSQMSTVQLKQKRESSMV